MRNTRKNQIIFSLLFTENVLDEYKYANVSFLTSHFKTILYIIPHILWLLSRDENNENALQL